MGQKTLIPWYEKTWNPVTGCTKVSPGCANCYAERHARRFWGNRKFTDIQCHEERLNQPKTWKKPARVFVDSMGDLFHDSIPTEFICRCFITMSQCPQHTFIILTKRPENMKVFLKDGLFGRSCILKNVWLGVSAENQKTANERIPILLSTRAHKRIISIEPMIGPVSLTSWINEIDWVICGCESGPRARPMLKNWASELKDECYANAAPFFLKQMMIDGKLVKMPEIDHKIWDQYPNE